ncbi:MAG TPA: hypothetical protein VH854_02805 [Thermoanaerobaculia bacterium]|nr:hypothetical protein [Thermoanaerobaculia bacterium]
MSLIDEALKRAQQAADREAPRQRPWSPAPLPDAGLARRRRLARSTMVGLAVALGIAAVAALLIWAVRAPSNFEPAQASAARVAVPTEVRRGGGDGDGGAPAMAAINVAAPTPRQSVATTPRSGVAPTPRERVAPPMSAGGTVAKRPSELVASIETTPVHVAPPPRAAEGMSNATGSPAVHAHAAPAPAGKSYKGKVALPDGGSVELGGIVWSEADPRALVNDRVVGVGAYVEGYTIERIEEDRVVMEKDGKRITITVK